LLRLQHPMTNTGLKPVHTEQILTARQPNTTGTGRRSEVTGQMVQQQHLTINTELKPVHIKQIPTAQQPDTTNMAEKPEVINSKLFIHTPA